MTSAAGLRTGAWFVWGEPTIFAATSHLGFDWLCIDQQHGRFDDRGLRDALSLPRNPEVDVMVRVASQDPTLIGRALDAGADGVIVPMICSAAEAARAVAACHYPPAGTRSSGPPLVIARDGVRDGAVRCSIMIETAEAVAAVDEIARLDGVDELFVGPNDLALALGCTVTELVGSRTELRTIVSAAHAAGIRAACFAGAPRLATALHAVGFDSVATTTEQVLVQAGAAAVLEAVASPA